VAADNSAAGTTGARSLALGRAWQASAAGQRGSALRDVRSVADRAAECGEHATEAELRHTAAMLDGAAEEAGRLADLAALTGSPAVGVWAAYAAAVTAVDGHRLDTVATEFEIRGARLLAADAAAAAHHQRGDRRRTARSGAVAARLAGWCGGPHTPALRRLDPPRLTGREREVADLVTNGLTAIADKLVVSVRTVETHLAHAYAKLGVADRTGLTKVLRPAS
jgi:DNA-binding CsgD family transcriptional regulator